MSAWLRQHRAAFLAALRKLAAQRIGGLASLLAIGVALALPAGAYALLDSVRPLIAGASLEPRLTVFLKPEASRTEVDALGRVLRADPRIAERRFISREEALKQLEFAQGMREVVAALGRNPLPDSFVLRASADPEALEALAGELRRQPLVAQVQLEAAWARRLAALAAVARLALLLLTGLLAFGLIAVTFNTTRLQILTQRDEIEVSRLIGATDAFIRRPFYYLGAIQGGLGAALALAIVWSCLLLLNREVVTLAESYGSGFRFNMLSVADAAAVVLAGAILGWLGAHLSVGAQLHRSDDFM